MTDPAPQFEGSVAIVGMAGRFPGAADVDTFWANLLAGRESIRTFTRDELLAVGHSETLVDDPAYVPAAAIPDDIEGLDLELFRLTRSEAEVIDPQQRVFLECAWEALEDAGSMLPDGERRTGVFASCDLNTYLPFVIAPRLHDLGSSKEFQIEIGNDKDFLATRVSYKLDLKGPSVVAQTACSSSLVAVHLACESLLSSACDVAVAGGSRLHVPLVAGHVHQPAGVSAAEPHCRAFDAKATGTIRGNGTAAVVLKRTEDAVADGDHIYALILGSAINNDGADKVGFTAPSVRGQKSVIREALAVADVAPEGVSYVETHGTGTALGDPIEVEALADALEARDPDRGPCLLGAVKTNVGHMGSTAGVAGLIKAALALEHETVPGTLHFTTPNPELRLAETRFVITREASPWPRRRDTRRVAGVSSFGIGGTNCHVVLGEPPLPAPDPVDEGPQLIVLSAATPSALRTSAANLAERLDRNDDVRLADVARTLQVGRRSLRYRWAAVARSIDEAAARVRELDAAANGGAAHAAGVCMLFPGQGAEFAGMGLDTMRRERSFRDDLERCAAILEEETGLDLIAFLRSNEVAQGRARTEIVQPALFALEYSLARLWMSWGIRPVAVAGHSIGEYSAAAVAGVFSLDDGIRVTAARGRAMAAMAPGAMTAVRSGEEALAPYLADGVSVAGVNAPALTVVAGREGQIVVFEERLRDAGIAFKRVPVDRAFHTVDVRAVASELESALTRATLRPPRLRCYSNRTGRALSAEEAMSLNYWIAHAASAVRFMNCVREVDRAGAEWFLEVGPGDGLSSFTRQTLAGSGSAGGRALPTLGRTADGERKTLLSALGALWEGGETVAWDAVGTSGRGRKVRLPTYPFERTRCWFGDERVSAAPPAAVAAAPVPVTGVPAADLGALVSEIVADVIGVEVSDVSPDTPFVEQGLESLALLEVTETIRQRLAVRVTLPDLLDELSTVSALARHLEGLGVAASPPAPVEDVSRAPAESDRPDRPPEPLTPFGPATAGGSLTDAQRAYLAQFVPRYAARTAASKAYNERYRRPHADPRNSAGFRSACKEIVYPLVCDRAEGATIWDLDGNPYVDLTMAFGVALFGHSPAFVRVALAEQLERGIAVGPQTAGSGVVAEQLCRLTGFDRAAFTNSGTEAVMAAIRLVRAATRRNRIVVFRGSYHGTYDGVLARAARPGSSSSSPAALGVPPSLVADVVVSEYGGDALFELLRSDGDTVAAVIVEPVQSRNLGFQPREYLQRLRAATREAGALLVVDEMITGFRCHAGGVNALWSLDADVVTYGKVLGGGLPIGAVAGRSEVLDLLDGGSWRYGDDSRPEADLTLFAGTFCKHPLAMAAANAVLTEIELHGPALQDGLARGTAELVAELRTAFDELECPIEIESFASQFAFRPGVADTIGDLFFKGMALRGVYIWEGRTSFLSTAHSEQDVRQVSDAAVEVARELLDARVLERVVRRPASGGEPVEPESEQWFACRDEQRLLWLGMEMQPDAAAAYNEVVAMPLAGTVDDSLVGETVRLLVARNDALRIRIDSMGQRQRVGDDVECPLEIIDVGDDESRWMRAREVAGSLRDTAFDLERGPIVRAALLRLRQHEHVVVLVAPHVAVDGWSLSVLRGQFEQTYAALVAGTPTETNVSPRFADFVRWEHAGLADGEDALDYWIAQLRCVDPSPVLPGVPAAARVYGARWLRQPFGMDASRRLGALCASVSATPFSAGLAAWCEALAVTTGRGDVTVAITLAGQPEIGAFDLVGYCLKVLPIRVQVTESEPFADLVRRVHTTVTEAREHWFVEQSALIERFWTGRDRTRPPMGGVTFQYEQPERIVSLPGTTPLDVDVVGRALTKWDATMVLFDEGECLTAELVYTAAALDEHAAAELLDRYVAILDRGCHRPSEPVLADAVAVAAGAAAGESVRPAKVTTDTLE